MSPRQGSPRNRRDEVLAETWADFQRETAEHVIKEIEEAGSFRRVVVGKPGTGIYSFTLTTWPGYLCMTGDAGSWVFSRLPDMFEFFRAPPGTINPSYWSQKLVAADVNSQVKKYDIEVLRNFLRDYYGGDDDADDRLASYLEALDSVEEEDEAGAIRALDEAGMDDPWDTSRTRFTHAFLWACHAIVLGIAKYDERKALAVMPVG